MVPREPLVPVHSPRIPQPRATPEIRPVPTRAPVESHTIPPSLPVRRGSKDRLWTTAASSVRILPIRKGQQADGPLPLSNSCVRNRTTEARCPGAYADCFLDCRF